MATQVASTKGHAHNSSTPNAPCECSVYGSLRLARTLDAGYETHGLRLDEPSDSCALVCKLTGDLPPPLALTIFTVNCQATQSEKEKRGKDTALVRTKTPKLYKHSTGACAQAQLHEDCG
jgi:hypothetical protein